MRHSWPRSSRPDIDGLPDLGEKEDAPSSKSGGVSRGKGKRNWGECVAVSDKKGRRANGGKQ